jgi:hypothetical protein
MHQSLTIARLIGPVLSAISIDMLANQSFGLSVLSYSKFFIIDGGIAVLLGELLCYFGYLDPSQLFPERAPARRRSRLRRRR